MGSKRKRNVNVFKATEGSEVNQSAASEYPSFTGSTGAQAIPAAFPGSCCLPRVRMWWHMDPFCMNTQHPLHSTQHLLWAWRSWNTVFSPCACSAGEKSCWELFLSGKHGKILLLTTPWQWPQKDIITDVFSLRMSPRFNGIVELKTLQCLNLVFLTLPSFCFIQATRFIKILCNYIFDP